jgi:hypothetical protein
MLLGSTHLINAGKYAAGIVYYVLYFNYRIKGTVSDLSGRFLANLWHAKKGSNKHSASFALFITFATINSVYSLVWDVLMDWNLFSRNARYRFLRNELAYKNQHWVRRYDTRHRVMTDSCCTSSTTLR